MGKKVKTGKQRKDRYYQLAKETGYRSRAAFKLIQLNRKFEFLQKSRVLIDLCAAPGGWLQVAQKYMPVSSVIVGVDLVPIKAIHNVITFQADITTQQCRQQLKKELKTWKADIVLHDGAPNLGKSWLLDAFGQVRLTLSALQLAAEFLMKGGWFVTKVFRSKDYEALMWVLKKLFKRVHATKPQASRHESAEIFVVCQSFLAPNKIDEKFFDPSYIFEDVDAPSDKKKKVDILKANKQKKKEKPEGYEEGDYTLHYKLNASDFIKSRNHMELLAKCHEILIDSEEIANHNQTTGEVKECCRDIKVLGRKELLLLIKWRRIIKKQLFKESKKDLTEDENIIEEVSDSEVEPEVVDEEQQKMKRKKKKMLKEKQKLQQRMNLKMILKNDQIQEVDQELFKLKSIKDSKHLNAVQEIDLNDLDIEESESEEIANSTANYISYEKDDEINHWTDSEDEDDDNGDEKWGNDLEEADIDPPENDNETCQLVVDLNKEEELKNKKKMFFEKEVFDEDMEDDEELELELIAEKYDLSDQGEENWKQKRNKSNKRLSDEELESDTDEMLKSQDEDKRFKEKCKEKVVLTPENLALGSLMIQSQKTKRDIMDDAWNRYTRGDEDDLPSWFRKDEEKHFRKLVPISEEKVAEYQARLQEINARPIKKVIEAKARKKKRALRRMEKARKKAEAITDAPDMTAREKAASIKSIYKKALKTKNKDVQYVVAKKHMGTRRPANVKGRYKVVDPRMKKDKRKQQMTENKGKKGKKVSKSKNSGQKRRTKR